MSTADRAHAEMSQTVLHWGTTQEAPSGSVEEPRVLLRVEEAAHRLGIERTMMYALIQRGDVESVRLGRLRRVPVECIDEFVASLRGRGTTGQP